MNGLIIASVVINGILTVITAANPEMPGAFTAIMGLFVALSVIGAIMISSGSKKGGAIMVIVGCIFFIPIGLIGVFGARKVLDELKRAEFNQQGQHTPPPLQPRPVTHAPGMAEQKTNPLPLLLVLCGIGLHLLLQGPHYARNMSEYGLSFMIYNPGSIILPVVLLADIVGAVLIFRKTAKTGGILVLAASAVYVARCVLTFSQMINYGMEMEPIVKVIASMACPAVIALVGGVLAIRSAAGEPGDFTRMGTTSA